ncbi:MAG: molybdate ABC transporter substrate-binding protein [Ktedonobacteraceae bacterium]|nr:molybdate ABC transporter substrate-binding protein [Ktedonobacteraceae bacterium]
MSYFFIAPSGPRDRAGRVVFLLAMLLCMLLAACGGTASGAATPSATITLKVFAAASLTESFNEIKTQYQAAHPNVNIQYNFNGSQILVQQMTNGAAADVFASADEANMQKASTASLVLQSQIFARNKLTVIVPSGNPGHVNTLKDLARKGLKLVLAAPDVPVGKYAQQVLDKMGASSDYGPDYVKNVKGNVVSQEENVKSVVQKVQLGEADAGIVYATDVTAAVAGKVTFIAIPDNFNVIAKYPIAVTKDSTVQAQAQAFVQYILSPTGQAVLSKYRFISPGS